MTDQIGVGGSGGNAITPASGGDAGVTDQIPPKPSRIVETSGNKCLALSGIRKTWSLLDALRQKNPRLVTDRILRLAFLGDDVTVASGPECTPVGPETSGSGVQTIADEASCDASGCNFDDYSFISGIDHYRMTGAIRITSDDARRTVSIDLSFINPGWSNGEPARITGTLVATERSLDGSIREVQSGDGQSMRFIGLTYEDGVDLVEATPTSGSLYAEWHSAEHRGQEATIPFP